MSLSCAGLDIVIRVYITTPRLRLAVADDDVPVTYVNKG